MQGIPHWHLVVAEDCTVMTCTSSLVRKQLRELTDSREINSVQTTSEALIQTMPT